MWGCPLLDDAAKLLYAGQTDFTCACLYVYIPGHHEVPPEAHTKILEKFPDNFPRNPGNVIPPKTEKKVEEVCITP